MYTWRSNTLFSNIEDPIKGHLISQVVQHTGNSHQLPVMSENQGHCFYHRATSCLVFGLFPPLLCFILFYCLCVFWQKFETTTLWSCDTGFGLWGLAMGFLCPATWHFFSPPYKSQDKPSRTRVVAHTQESAPCLLSFAPASPTGQQTCNNNA